MELFPTKNVTAEEAKDALLKQKCRFGTLLEITTDCGSQFMNATLEGYATLSGDTIPYAKEENGIVERMKKSTATFGKFYQTMNARIPKHAAFWERYTNQVLLCCSQ